MRSFRRQRVKAARPRRYSGSSCSTTSSRLMLGANLRSTNPCHRYDATPSSNVMDTTEHPGATPASMLSEQPKVPSYKNTSGLIYPLPHFVTIRTSEESPPAMPPVQVRSTAVGDYEAPDFS